MASSSKMEEDIDLRTYVQVLSRYWKWILGLALVATLAAYAVSTLLPPSYEGSAVVVVTQPRYQIQFDPQVQTVQEWKPAYQALPTLATSDDILQAVVDAYTPSPHAGIDGWRLAVLNDMVKAATGADPSLLLLQARSRSAQDAAAITNLWADTLVRVGNEIYGGSEKDVAFLEREEAKARQALDKADQALVEFEATNQTSIVSTQLDSLRQTQTDKLTDQRTIGTIIQDLQGLRNQLSAQASREPASLADNLTALLLQIRAFNASDSAPIQLQINSSESLSSRNPEEQVVLLDELIATLQSKSAEIDRQLVELQPQMLASQQKLQETTLDADRLTSAQELARDAYLALARKLDETRVVAQEEYGMFQVASYAAEPEKPVAPRKVFNAVLAGLLALMVGSVGAFAVEYWHHTKGEAQTPKAGPDAEGGDR